MILQLTRAGVKATRSAASRIVSQFERDNCLVLPRFLEPALLKTIQQGFKLLDLREKAYTIGSDASIRKGPLMGAVTLLLNQPELIDQVRRLTGCASITGFVGRIYQLRPGDGHDFDWHNDVMHHRVIAVTVNLSTGIFKGGELEIREAKTRRVIRKIANVGPGDAVMFRVDPRFEHRVMPITGDVPKTALAGWFVEGTAAIANPGEWFESDGERPIALKDRVRLPPDVVSCRYGDGTVIVNVTTGACFGLDEVGSRVWESLTLHDTLGDVARKVAREYGVASKVVAPDVVALVSELKDKGLLTLMQTRTKRRNF